MRRLLAAALPALLVSALAGCADDGEVRDGVTIKTRGSTPSLWDGR